MGRPSNQFPDVLRTRVWFCYVARRLSLPETGYALENFFESKKIDKTNGVITRPCKYDKYQTGQHVPSEKTICLVEMKVPGSRFYLEHPFWKIISLSDLSHEELFALLHKLRPDIKKIIFDESSSDIRYTKLKTGIAVFEQLRDEADWDALTASIGLIRGINFDEVPFISVMYVRYIAILMMRFLGLVPFNHIAFELFDYIKSSFLTTENTPELKEYLDSIDIEYHAHISEIYLGFLYDRYVFKSPDYPSPACLHIAEKYIKPNKLIPALFGNDRNAVLELRRSKEFRNMKRKLRRWEESRKCNLIGH